MFLKALYFTALVPPSAIKEKVKKLKLEIKEKFHAAHALKLPAHITLIPPVWLEDKQEKLFLERTKKISKTQTSFPVNLNGFGHFGQRVIFIEVVDNKSIKNLHQNLIFELEEFLPSGEKKEIHPHITIATRDLSRENFKMAWQAIKERKFDAGFEANIITIFRHNGKTWDVLEDFSFS